MVASQAKAMWIPKSSIFPNKEMQSSHPLYLKEVGTMMERKQFNLFLDELSYFGSLK